MESEPQPRPTRDQALEALASYGWANQSFGDNFSKYGKTWLICNEQRELEQLADVLEEQTPVEPTWLVGNFLLTKRIGYDPLVESFETADEAEREFTRRYVEWQAWEGCDD